MVKDINAGVVLYKGNESKSMIPASTMKLVTTASALEMLGSDFRFETHIEIDGKIGTDSTLYGNIYIKGGGDPTLGSEFAGNRKFLNCLDC
jgi:D-alanyl-D-alanine carboxypeptidase/D-alanyl-D-alanine-endopeptidase (penicillin-binding protein 4)